MKNRINIVSSLQFVRLNEVSSFQKKYNGAAQVTTVGWKALPIYEGSVRMTVSDDKTGGGRLVTTDIFGRLKSNITVNCLGLLMVTMCDDSTYIIGTPDLPVSIDLTTSLTQKTFRIKHLNTVFPYIKAV